MSDDTDDDRRSRIFGSVAEDYERRRPGYPDVALDWLLPTGARRVADVGAGTGKLTRSLLARGLEVVAVEPDPAMLAVLRRELPTAETVHSGADRLTIPDDSVDMVLAAQAWHWFPQQAAFAEARRVVRPGGRLGLIAHAPVPQEPFELELARLTSRSPVIPPGRFVTEPPELPGVPTAAAATAAFPWTWEVTVEDIVAVVATYSLIAVMPADERTARLAQIARVAAAEARRRGTDTIPLRQETWCVRVEL